MDLFSDLEGLSLTQPIWLTAFGIHKHPNINNYTKYGKKETMDSVGNFHEGKTLKFSSLKVSKIC